ncbi:MAG: pre-peptidase C-terminal domain-containing protein [Saprospiraceae bacterium]
MKNIRNLLIPLLCFWAALSVKGQGINGVAVNPSPAYTSSYVTATVEYYLGNGCWSFTGQSSYWSGTTLNVFADFYNSGQPFCPMIYSTGTFSLSLGYLSANNYTIRVWDYDSGGLLFTQPFTVYNGGGSGGSNGCGNPVVMACGNTYNGNNSIGGYNWNSYTANNGSTPFTDMTGPETIHQFTLGSTSNVTITLGNLSADLDLMLNPACSNSGIIAWSGNSGNTGEQIVYTSLPAGTYRIIVDGWSYAVSDYTLSLLCSNTSPCGTPSAQQINVTNATQTSATWSCSMSGATSYQYRYRRSGTSSWTSLSGVSSGTVTVNGLLACTTYDVQVRVYCPYFGWTSYSGTKTFQTQCAPCSAPAPSQLFATNVGQTSATLNCTPIVGALAYDWQIRPYGTSTWTDLPGATTNSTFVSGLLPNTLYEFRASVRCSNGTWSAWSVPATFSTSFSDPCSAAQSASCGGFYTGSTLGAVNFFSNYSCTNWDESGGERIFRVNYTGGTLTASLSNLSFDADVFILSACSSNNCRASGDDFATLSGATPGVYYIVVDGYQGQSGSFALSISCNSGNASNDEPCWATVLTANNACNPTSSSNVGATITQNPSPGTVSNCFNSNMRDVWFKFTMPSTGKVYFYTFAGSLTDAVLAAYSGEDCSNLTYFGCIDDTPNDAMPSGTITGTPGNTYHLRVWGYNGQTGTFSICLQTAYSLEGPDGDESRTADGIYPPDPAAETDNTAQSSEPSEPPAQAGAETGEEAAERSSTTPEPALNLFPVPATDRLTMAVNMPKEDTVDVQVFDMTGKLVLSRSDIRGEAGTHSELFDVSSLPAGTYVAKVQVGGKVLTGRFTKVE